MSITQKNYDFLVIGSGISGMTLALLLAKTGAKVAVLEKSAAIGGSMQRFSRNGCPLDTGFHFTTSLTGAFGDMFHFLEMKEYLKEITVDKKIYLAEVDRMFHLPHGHENILKYYAAQFPGTEEKLRDFFDLEKRVYQNTPLFSFDKSATTPLLGIRFQPEDNVVLTDYLKRQNFPPELELLLFSFAICCCGTPAEEISLSSFCRISYGLHDRLVRFDGGGDAVISLFRQKARQAGVTIFTNTYISECVKSQTEKSKCHEIITNTGARINFENCIFTTHPKDIFNTIVPLLKTGYFQEQIDEYEESCGFFTLWAQVAPDAKGRGSSEYDASLISFLNKTKLATLMSPNEPENTATGIMTVKEHTNSGEECETLTIFENTFPEETKEWQDTYVGERGCSYTEYKQRRTRELLNKCYKVRPELKGRLKILSTASQLSYRDYLSPYGSAYGIRQKVGQFNIFGRLPIRNFYAAGQNALLPGAFGAMQSSFILWRKLIGENLYSTTITDFYKKHC